jgi:glucose-6-phosphate 1-epimerase
MLIRVW